MFKAYYRLTKPGIIYGNLLTAVAGFLFGSKWHITLHLLLGLVIGTTLIIASACIINNYFDRELDKKMVRTSRRALATGVIPPAHALVLALVVGIVGFAVLIALTNIYTIIIGVIAFVDYVVFYGAGKRKTVFGTLIGSVAGAAPVTAGYCCATDRFDSAAVLVFLLLVFWQMAHFYAIAIYRLDDYRSAGLPVHPLQRSVAATKRQIVLFIGLFLLCSVLFGVYHYTGISFVVVMVLGSAWWLGTALKGWHEKNVKAWARRLFLASLLIITLSSVMLAVGPLLP